MKKVKVSNTIVTSKPTSFGPFNTVFGIDKIVLDLNHLPYIDSIIKSKNHKIVDRRIGFNKAIKVDDWITFVHYDKLRFNRAIIKGGTFQSYQSLKTHLSTFIPEIDWHRLDIAQIEYRIDFYYSEFKDINSRIYVSGKKTFERVIDQGDEATRYFGKKPKVQTLYSKEYESGLEEYEGVTRFESRFFSGSFGKGWERKFSNLEKKSLDKNFNPFRNVFYLDYKLSQEKSCRVKMFSTLVDIVGFQRARLHFNSKDNFVRSRNLLFTDYSETCLGDYYYSEMKKYFSKEEV